jgi:hypothetical protein
MSVNQIVERPLLKKAIDCSGSISAIRWRRIGGAKRAVHGIEQPSYCGQN